jgi:hypothetical protein
MEVNWAYERGRDDIENMVTVIRLDNIKYQRHEMIISDREYAVVRSQRRACRPDKYGEKGAVGCRILDQKDRESGNA